MNTGRYITTERARALLRMTRSLLRLTDNPTEFARELCVGLKALLAAEVVCCVSADLDEDGLWTGALEHIASSGWRSDDIRAAYVGSGKDPTLRDPVMAAVLMSLDTMATMSRTEAIGNDVWTLHPHRTELLARAALDESIASMYRYGVSGFSVGVIRVFFAAGETVVPVDDSASLHILLAELGGVIWSTIGSTSSRTIEPIEVHVRSLTRTGGSNDKRSGLTTAQRVVLPHLLSAKSESEIAKAIHRSRYTVHDHARAIYDALGVKNRLELVLKYKSLADEERSNMA